MENKSKIIVISLCFLSVCLLILGFLTKDDTDISDRNFGDVSCMVTSGPNQVFGEDGAYHTVANCGRDFKKTGDCYEKGGTVDTSNCGPDDGVDCYTYRKYHVECSEDVKPTSCNPGHYLNSSGCHNCDNGRWSDGGDATTCYPCPAGYYCVSGIKTQCTGNKYSSSGKSSCMSCTGIIKKNSAGENIGCDYSTGVSCTGNTYLENNECKDCSGLSGNYYCTPDHKKALCDGVVTANHTQCTTGCNEGQYLTSSGCKNCGDGEWSNGGSVIVCSACPAGYACKNGVKTQCTGKEYSSGGRSQCLTCEGVVLKNDKGENTGCDNNPCIGDTYLEDGVCKKCSLLTGKYYCTPDHKKALCNYTVDSTHTKCENTNVNMRCALNGVTTGRYLSNGTCIDCPSPYKYSQDNNSGGLGSCYANVPAGSVLNFTGSSGFITACPTDTYSEDNNNVYYGGSTRCISCSTLTGNYYCTPDHKKALCNGTVNATHTKCENTNVNMRCALNGVTTGRYLSNGTCIDCPSPYKYSQDNNSGGLGSCYANVPAGSVLNFTGSSGFITACPTDTYSEDNNNVYYGGSTRCISCSTLTGNYYCTPDHKKALCNGTVNATHTKCESTNANIQCALNGVTTGRYLSNGVCIDCPYPYKYSKDNNSSGLSSCYAKVSAGNFLNFNGSTGYILTCPADTYSEDSNSVYYGGSTRCISCSTLTGNYYCTPDHKKAVCNYLVNQNHTKCIDCPTGTTLDANDKCVRNSSGSSGPAANLVCPDLYVGATGVCTLSNGTISSGSVNSSNPNVIEILGSNSMTINIGGKAVGSSTISGSTVNGNNFSAISNVRANQVDNTIKTIRIDGPTSIAIKSSNETRVYRAIVTPISYNDQIIWSTSDSSIATISSNGTLTALKAGTVTVFAKSNANSSVSDSLNITITNETCSITINNVSNSSLISVKDTVKVSFKVDGSNCSTSVDTKLSNFTGPSSVISLDTVEFKPTDSCKVGTIKGCISGSNVCSNTISVTIKCNSTSGGQSGTSGVTPPSGGTEPVLQQYCYANAVTLKEATLATLLTSPISPYMYLVTDENNSLITDASKCVASACYFDSSTKDYKWATIGSLPSSYIKQDDILVEDKCQKNDTCMVLITKDSVDYKWITTKDEYNNLIKEGYTEVNANESSCKQEAKCYNRDNDYVWSFVQPDGYTVIDLPSEECVPVVIEEEACYAHKQDNGTYEYKWEKDNGGILTTHDKDHCKSNIACYKYKDGKSYIGDYSLNSDYTIIDNGTCGNNDVINNDNVDNKNTTSGKNNKIIIILIILLIILIIYYIYRKMRNNEKEELN